VERLSAHGGVSMPGVVERWVTPEDANANLIGIARLNEPRLAIYVEQAFPPAHLPRRARSPSLSSADS
jgi:hypothetical protein